MQQQEVKKKKFDRYQVLDWMEEEGLFCEGLVEDEEGATCDEESELKLLWQLLVTLVVLLEPHLLLLLQVAEVLLFLIL